MSNYIVYCLTNHANGKRYIGQTNNWKRRWRGHCKPSADSVISRAIHKHGKDAFTVDFFYSELSLDEANYYETRLIRVLKTLVPHGYNVKDGGSSGNPFAGFTDKEMEAYRRKQSASKKGKNNPNWRKQRSPESLKKWLEANKGKKRSLKTRQRISDSKRGEKNPAKRPESRQKMIDNHADVSGEKNPMSSPNRDKRRGQSKLFKETVCDEPDSKV